MKKKILVPVFLLGMVVPACSSNKAPVNPWHGQMFIGEYGDKATYVQEATKLNGELADEGFVLLKNNGNLPLNPATTKISIVGKSSTNLARGGAGSGAGSTDGSVKAVDLQTSLTSVGFSINTKLTSFYNTNSQSGSGRTNGNDGWKGNSEVHIGETPISAYSQDLLNSLDEYNGAIIQVITREGSEGCDVKTCDARDFGPRKSDSKFPNSPFSDKHALELSDNEQALFDEIKKHTNNVIFVINSSNIFECDQLQKDDKVAGILWIGNPGDVGPGAVGRILSGQVNPSGRTVDTWARDFTKDPTFQNFSDNAQTNKQTDSSGNPVYAAQDTMFAADGAPMMSLGTLKGYDNHSKENSNYADAKNRVMKGGINGVKPSAYVSYEEGIYVDYRYYETRYADMAAENKEAADAWYDGQEGVVYPFGYGLSYTTFEQEIVKVRPLGGSKITAKTDVIEVSVKVTNTGTVAGKDAVQLYWKAPYTAGGIEKADHVLCAFDKTKTIQPGDSQLVHLTFHVQDVANYDFTDANNNGFKGYELDAGEYQVLLGKNAHESYDSESFVIGGKGIKFKTDRFTGTEVKNRFTDRGFYSSMPSDDDIPFEQMSRADFVGTFPHHPGAGADRWADRTVGDDSRFEEFLTHEFSLEEAEEDENYEYVPQAAIKTAKDGAKWEQAASTMAKADRIQLLELANCEKDDPMWDELINQMTYAEMLKFVENNRMSSPALNEIGKGGFSEGDGPQKFNIMWWVSSPIIAATFNPELAHKQGEFVGMESQISGKAGWWGCAVNTHRSPFGGRNFEYYSADPFLMGRIAALVVGAATDRGVYAYFKHFAVNDQEKNRESGISFVNEQALREIYLKSFQMVFEEGKSIGVMGSYNRLGLMETAASYPLMTEVLREEWGFQGAVLSDMTHSGNGSVNFKCYECVTPRVIAGCNSQLDSGGFNGQTSSQVKWDATALDGKGAPVIVKKDGTTGDVSYTWWYAIRNAVKDIMYMSVNSTGMRRGLTQVVGELDEEVVSGTKFSYDVELPEEIAVGETYNGKTIESIDFEMNKRSDFLASVKFANGTLSGSIKNVGVYRFDAIAYLGLEGDAEAAVAYKFIIRVVPQMD
ncbi:MAG: glycoside hydrolase family 3 C-terminal domain-containing protein [Bacilli bacterium]|nr:glycoside hydrolase family 3 C-terminal domain-containing protein [Bacilli bacterium]